MNDPVSERLTFYVNKLLEVGSPSLSCADEQCVLEWVMHNTQVAQSIYDSALDAELEPDELSKVEDLYRHTLQTILEHGMRGLGILEV